MIAEKEYTLEFPTITGKNVLVTMLVYGAFIYKKDDNYLSLAEVKSLSKEELVECESKILQGFDEGEHFSYEIPKRAYNVFDETTMQRIIKTIKEKFNS